MKVGIVGFGFVGQALFKSLIDVDDVFKVDPKLGSTIEELIQFEPNIVFLTLPTPMNNDGTQNISIIKEVIEELKVIDNKSLIVLKSTVLPDALLDLNSKIENFIFNPEFLREKTAENDFINGELIIFGGTKENCLRLSEFYKKHTKCVEKNHILTDLVSASLVKYTINSFLASKVIFFNQIKDIFDQANAEESWEEFTKMVSKDSRIGNSHMSVPGHDGRRGFGGACFPKDTNAFSHFASQINAPFSSLKNTIRINNNLRTIYNEPTDREKEQNISFEDNED